MEVTPSCGNIFADLGLPNPELALAKAALSIKIEDIIQERGLTQAQAAKLMGLTQPNVSDILRGHMDGFTLDRLVPLPGSTGSRDRDRCPASKGPCRGGRCGSHSMTSGGRLCKVQQQSCLSMIFQMPLHTRPRRGWKDVSTHSPSNRKVGTTSLTCTLHLCRLREFRTRKS